MALFGSNNRKRRPYDTSGFGDGARGTGMAAPEENPTFWQGGSKFGVRDGIAGALAALGDVFSQRGGGQGGAVQMLAGGRASGLDAMRAAQAKAAETAAMDKRYQAAGYNPQQSDLLAHGGSPPKEDTDVFTRTLKAAGIDPAGPQGQELYRQRASTMALPAPSLIGSPDTGYQWAQPPSPTMPQFGGQQASSMPTVADEASYSALPPGAQYRDPAGNIRTKGGGAGNGAGGFPIPSGNPLQRPW